jgi:hypothetical protein
MVIEMVVRSYVTFQLRPEVEEFSRDWIVAGRLFESYCLVGMVMVTEPPSPDPPAASKLNVMVLFVPRMVGMVTGSLSKSTRMRCGLSLVFSVLRSWIVKFDGVPPGTASLESTNRVRVMAFTEEVKTWPTATSVCARWLTLDTRGPAR